MAHQLRFRERRFEIFDWRLDENVTSVSCKMIVPSITPVKTSLTLDSGTIYFRASDTDTGCDAKDYQG